MEYRQSQEAATKLKLNYLSQLSKGEQPMSCVNGQFSSCQGHLKIILGPYLSIHWGGMHRVPSVFFSQPLPATSLDINVPSYECLPCKPRYGITQTT